MNKIIFFSFISILLFSCKKTGCSDPSAINYAENSKEDGSCEYKLNLSINLTNNNEVISKNDVIDIGGNYYRIEKFKFYFCDINLKNSSDEQEISDVHLFDLDDVTTHSISKDLLNINYSELSLSLGLNSTLNNTDPSSYDANHPLSLNNGTYWPMNNASYIFVMIEGKLDTIGNGDFYNKTYHLAHNDLLREIDLNYDFNSDYRNELSVNIELSEIFNNVDLSQDLPHRSENNPLANLIMDNFKNAFKIQ